MAPQEFQTILQGLSKNEITVLNLSGEGEVGPRFTPEQVKLLAEALETNTSLQTLDLSSNDIGPAGATKIAAALQNNTSLQRLDLSHNKLGPAGATKIAAALQNNTSLQRLDFRFNKIGPAGATQIIAALKTSTSLNLDLSANEISDAGATKIAVELKTSNFLRCLDLSGNPIGDAGATQIAEALETNTFLQGLNLSYSNCENGYVSTVFLSWPPPYGREQLFLSDSSTSRKPLYLLMQSLMAKLKRNREVEPGRRINTSGMCILIAATRAHLSATKTSSADIEKQKTAPVTIATTISRFIMGLFGTALKTGQETGCTTAAATIATTAASVDNTPKTNTATAPNHKHTGGAETGANATFLPLHNSILPLIPFIQTLAGLRASTGSNFKPVSKEAMDKFLGNPPRCLKK